MVKVVLLGIGLLVLSPAQSHAFGKKRSAPPNPAWDGNIVYYITGGPFETQPGSVNDAAAELRDDVRKEHPNAYFESIHNSNWESVCSTIKSKRQAAGAPQGRTAIVGHSYGASASTRVARCLRDAGIPIDLTVTLDMIRRPVDSDPDVVPGNVVSVWNLYQDQDTWLRGKQNVRREDGSRAGITNSEVTSDLGFSEHFGLVEEVMLNTRVVEDRVLEALR